MKTPHEVIAEVTGKALADSVLVKLEQENYVVIPLMPTDSMASAGGNILSTWWGKQDRLRALRVWHAMTARTPLRRP